MLRANTYMDLGGTLASTPSRLSSLVPRMVIFLRTADAWRVASGPDCGSAARSATMEATSSASRAASPYSRAHGSAAIAGREMDPIVWGAWAGTWRRGRSVDPDSIRLGRVAAGAGCLLGCFPPAERRGMACGVDWLVLVVVSSPCVWFDEA